MKNICITANGDLTKFGWALAIVFFPILVPTGAIISCLLHKWKNDYEEFEFARRLTKSECFDKLNVHDQLTLVDIQQKSITGYLKWKKVLMPSNALYVGLRAGAKYYGLI